ncbi:MAG: hypothetical protein CUN53_11345 [Phototrophicales bacterium]|nr:MAG: hypothetical protein CUN53_11345 [Phototrophicales bacterium]
MSIISYHAPALRAIAESLDLEPVTRIARQPGVQAVYRVTTLIHDGRASSAAATITRVGQGVVLEMAYQRALEGRHLARTLPIPRYERFASALVTLGFDHLPDQADLPDRPTADLWMIERAAGTFQRAVIVAPALAQGVYLSLVDAVRTYLPEALRELP